MGLPEGWVVSSLEGCVEIHDSTRKPVNNKERQSRIHGVDESSLFPYFGATGQVGFIDDYLFDGEYVALGEDGVPFFDPIKHKAYVLTGKTWVNNHAHVLKGAGEIQNRYLCYFLNQFDYHGYVNGATRLKLTQQSMRKIPVLLAPLNEQIRIANKLDSLLAKVEIVQNRLEKIPVLLKRFRQSVLAAATSGKLTGSNIDDWQVKKLNDVATNIVDCPHSTPKWEEQGRLCVRTTAFKPFKLDLNDKKFVSEETFTKRTSRLKPLPGDILYSREGAILGIACQIPEGVELCLGQRMVVIRSSEIIDPKYLTIILNSEVTGRTVRSLIIGNAAPRINMSSIKGFMIPYPEMEEQTEIVRRVESLFAQAAKVESQHQAAKTRLDKLTQSILAKAFRGELVPQDPNDEPASELLKRIQAERELQTKTKPKRARKKSAVSS